MPLASSALRAACAPTRTPEGFRNVDGSAVAKPLSALLRWKWQAWRDGLPPAPRQPTPTVAPELAALRGNTGPAGRRRPGSAMPRCWCRPADSTC